MFQQYPQTDVNEPILLHEGRFRVRAGDRLVEASGSAHLRWLPSPGIDFDMETDEPVGLDLDSLTVELQGFTTKNVFAYSTGAPGLIRASAAEMEWGGSRRLLSVGFQIVNFPDFVTPGPAAVPGDPTSVGSGYGTIQTVGLNHDGWQIRIVAVPESGDRYKKLKATGGYALTHVGHLKRSDDSTFSVEKAKDILESLRVFLSFARGAMCGMPIQWGRGAEGKIVWRWFGSPVVDRWKGPYSSWIGTNHGTVLAELFDSFCRKHDDPKIREPLAVAVHMYSHCNTRSSGMEGSIILGTAALELLGTLIVENHGDIQDAAKRLRKLLSALKTQPTIPPRFQALARFAKKNGNWDAPKGLVQFRHGFVHPTEERRKIVFAPEAHAATSDACTLAVWYQELALLHLLGHAGSYCNRTTAAWAWEVEPVPWSKS